MVNETYAIAELFFARFFGGSEVEFFVALIAVKGLRVCKY